jgi:hypothetical protein
MAGIDQNDGQPPRQNVKEGVPVHPRTLNCSVRTPCARQPVRTAVTRRSWSRRCGSPSALSGGDRLPPSWRAHLTRNNPRVTLPSPTPFGSGGSTAHFKESALRARLDGGTIGWCRTTVLGSG